MSIHLFQVQIESISLKTVHVYGYNIFCCLYHRVTNKTDPVSSSSKSVTCYFVNEIIILLSDNTLLEDHVTAIYKQMLNTLTAVMYEEELQDKYIFFFNKLEIW
jgi:hypothetical protein